MDALGLVTAGAFASLLVEGVKFVLRRWILKNPDYDFPLEFYLVSLPTLNILVTPVLAFLGFSGFTFPTDWLGFAQSAAQVLIASLISVFVYNNSIEPLKNYKKELNEGQ